MSELIKIITRVAGQDFDSPECRVKNPRITARESIELADYIVALEAERDALRNVCAQAYQMAGAINAPIEVLDNLSAAANGDPIPHDTFLPIFGDHLAAHDAEVAANAVEDSWSALSSSFDFGLYGARLGLVDDLDAFFSRYAAQLRAKAKP